MRQKIIAHHHLDDDGNPSGGETNGLGIWIQWQAGPLGRGDDRKEPNGAFVEGVIAAAIDRLEYYQDSQFACQANADAIKALETALDVLDQRTADREARDVEGTHGL